MRLLGPGLVALAMAATAVIAPARAADMALPPNYYPPAAQALPPATYNWTGIYAGGNVGGGVLSDSINQATAATVNFAGTQTARPSGVIGGGQLGANYQFDKIVVGVEGAWSATNISGYGISNAAGGAPFAGVTSERNSSNPLWLAAVSGRVGYAANDWLFYLKGGGAWLQQQYVQDLLAGATLNTQSMTVSRSGLVIGGGIEYGLTENLSARLEYDYYDFGNTTIALSATPLTSTAYLHTLTFGLNWRFTPAPSGQWSCPTC